MGEWLSDSIKTYFMSSRLHKLSYLKENYCSGKAIYVSVIGVALMSDEKCLVTISLFSNISFEFFAFQPLRHPDRSPISATFALKPLRVHRSKQCLAP